MPNKLSYVSSRLTWLLLKWVVCVWMLCCSMSRFQAFAVVHLISRTALIAVQTIRMWLCHRTYIFLHILKLDTYLWYMYWCLRARVSSAVCFQLMDAETIRFTEWYFLTGISAFHFLQYFDTVFFVIGRASDQ